MKLGLTSIEVGMLSRDRTLAMSLSKHFRVPN